MMLTFYMMLTLQMENSLLRNVLYMFCICFVYVLYMFCICFVCDAHFVYDAHFANGKLTFEKCFVYVLYMFSMCFL